MRKLLLAVSILIVVSLINYACNQTKSVSPGYGSGRDTSWTVVTYVYSAANDEYRTGQAVRFSWDTTFPDPKDKTRNIPQRDTVYNILNDHWGVGFTFSIPYSRIILAIPFPYKFTHWIQRNLWRHPKRFSK